MRLVHRRTFLKRSLVVGVAAGGGATFLATRSNRELPRPTRELYVLDEVAFGVLACFAERILPIEPADPRWIAHEIDRSLRFVSPEAQADTVLVLNVLENSLSGVFTRLSATLFSDLEPEGRDHAISRWGASPVGMLAGATNSLRKLCLGVFYGPLDNAKAIGYPGPRWEVPAPKALEARAPISKPYVPKPQREAAAPAEDTPTTETATAAEEVTR